ncbi:MAG: hypothetical protein U5R49_12830 [Deltaproteobacteria bacterium]|nr:hypothetical protein [Deltaproteobacteria bacterium]
MPSDYRKITEDNKYRRGHEFDDIGRLLSEQLYSDRGHFVYELLQNAEDALGKRFGENPTLVLPKGVRFSLYKDRLEFCHYGQPFNEDDVRGISDVLKGTKAGDFNQIGKFGIGFKSVYCFTATPEIHSGDEHFIIERFIRPKDCKPSTQIDERETVFIFPFNHEGVEPEESFQLIYKKLKTLGPDVLLFLRNIDRIDWEVENRHDSGTYTKEVRKTEGARLVKVSAPGSMVKSHQFWLLFDRALPSEEHHLERSSNNKLNVEIAFRLAPISGSNRFGVVRVDESPLVAFFKTEKQTQLGFLIQGPYVTTPSRDNIPKENKWNQSLINKTSELIVETLFHFKKAGMMCPDLIEALPINFEDFPSHSMFWPIYNSVKETFSQNPLLPTDHEGFVCAHQAKLSRGADLRRLFNKNQLKDLFESDDAISWLPGDITPDRRPGLRSYLMQELDIDEITPEGAIRRLTKDFLKKQPDTWFVELYTFLDAHKDLWEKPNSVARSKEIIRLEDGSLIKPFSEDGKPNAYLPTANKSKLSCVKRVIAEQQEARSSLKRMNFMEPDLFSEIMEFVLPKYKELKSAIPFEENITDIRAIIRLTKRPSLGRGDDSSAIKRALLAQLVAEDYFDILESLEVKPLFQSLLEALPLFCAYRCDHKNISMKSAGELYLPSTKLLMYFDGNSNAWFLSNDYPEDIVDFCLRLGCAKSPRSRESGLSDANGYIILENSHGRHKRGLDGFDPNFYIEGLGHALKKPTIDKSTYIWNELLIPNSEKINGIVEFSPRQDYSKRSTEESYSSMGKVLLNSSWIPLRNGQFKKPTEINIDEIPEYFKKDDKLCHLLKISVNEADELERKFGIKAEHIHFIKQHLKEFEEWKHSITNRPTLPEDLEEDDPIRRQRREEKLLEGLRDSPKRSYDRVRRSARTSRNKIDPSTWLREKYTNEKGQMVCQICRHVMPFKKPNNEYYFDAVEIIGGMSLNMKNYIWLYVQPALRNTRFL